MSWLSKNLRKASNWVDKRTGGMLPSVGGMVGGLVSGPLGGIAGSRASGRNPIDDLKRGARNAAMIMPAVSAMGGAAAGAGAAGGAGGAGAGGAGAAAAEGARGVIPAIGHALKEYGPLALSGLGFLDAHNQGQHAEQLLERAIAAEEEKQRRVHAGIEERRALERERAQAPRQLMQNPSNPYYRVPSVGRGAR